VVALYKILAIFRKDFRDALRDARVLVALIVPLGIGVFYNLTFEDETTPEATVVYAAAEQTRLPEVIRSFVGDTVRITFEQLPDESEVRQRVADEDADLGLIVPAGFDAAVAAGQSPELIVLQPPSASFASSFVAAAVEPAVRALSGQQPPAIITMEQVAETPDEATVIDSVGLRVWAVMAATVMMISMIAMLAVPIVLTEEVEKKTLDALILIVSYPEVIAAKALLGVVYVAVMVPVLLLITRIQPSDSAIFVATVVLLSVTLLGFGLLMGGMFKNANQLNTWGGVFLLPVIAPAFIVGLGLPDTIDRIASIFPTGGATKLLLDSATDQRLFSDSLTSFVVMAVWGFAAYALLVWQLSRRQA